MKLLEIGLAGWIVEDGNYKDFKVGDVRSFALEFGFCASLAATPAGPVSHRHLGYATHAVTGRRIYEAARWSVVDVGVLAFREANDRETVPEFFSGDIYIGVDPYFYFESLAREPSAPALIYDWQIHRIEVETAPRILMDGMWVYDPELRKLADVATSKGGDEMVLHCELLSDTPKHRRTYL